MKNNKSRNGIPLIELIMVIVGLINPMNILMRQHGEKRGAPDQFQ